MDLKKFIDNMIFPQGTYCIICGKYIDETRSYCLCDHCIRHMNFDCHHIPGSQFFDYGFCAMGYGLYESRMIFNLKYDGHTYIARIIADIIYDSIMANIVENSIVNKQCEQERMQLLEILRADMIVPVPIHKDRLNQRGFNQTEKIGKHLSKKMGIPVNGKILIREKQTHTQRALSSEERVQNMEGAFSLYDKHSYDKTKGKRIILLDDIYTTGATVNACAKILKDAGAEKIYVLTLLSAGNRHHLMVK